MRQIKSEQERIFEAACQKIAALERSLSEARKALEGMLADTDRDHVRHEVYDNAYSVLQSLQSLPDLREAERAVIEAAIHYKKFREENPLQVGTSARKDLFEAIDALASSRPTRGSE